MHAATWLPCGLREITDRVTSDAWRAGTGTTSSGMHCGASSDFQRR